MKKEIAYHCEQCGKESQDRHDQCKKHPDALMRAIVKRTSGGQVTYQSTGYAD